MIAVVGNIKVDESNPERIKYLIACIRSYLFLSDDCKFILSLDNASGELYGRIYKELSKFKHYTLIRDVNIKGNSYGGIYTDLLNNLVEQPFVINFMEDHFMVCNDQDKLNKFLYHGSLRGVDIYKASFFAVERNSIFDKGKPIQSHWVSEVGDIFINDYDFHKLYQKYYGSRYYIGTNFITATPFAVKFWNRHLGSKPHAYEIGKFDLEWQHIVMFPNFELQCAIDDDHGEPNSCLLKRNDCEKWNQIWSQLN